MSEPYSYLPPDVRRRLIYDDAVLGIGAPQERIAAAACRHKGQVFHLPPPARHWNVIAHIVSECKVQEHEFPICSPPDQGFVTDTGRFVGRIEARDIAREAGQLLDRAYVTSQLFSEDVW